MGFLYILSEGERDGLFYELMAERVTGLAFERPTDLRLRHGANWKSALAGSRLLLNRVKHWTEPQNVAVILAIDNDRTRGHPGAVPGAQPVIGHDLRKQPRYPAVIKMIADALGSDRAKWPVDVAVAVPMEMIESWILLLCDPHRPALPVFADARQAIARECHGTSPPPQLT